jgi:hypothetical protein
MIVGDFERTMTGGCIGLEVLMRKSLSFVRRPVRKCGSQLAVAGSEDQLGASRSSLNFQTLAKDTERGK